MKTIANFFWIVNVFLIAYMGFACGDTATVRHKDYALIKTGNVFFKQISQDNDTYFQKEYFENRINFMKRAYGYRRMDNTINNMLLIKQITDVYAEKLATFPSNNNRNIEQAHLLLTNYAKEIKSMDTSFRDMTDLNFPSVYKQICPKNVVLQETYFDSFQQGISHFYKNAIHQSYPMMCNMSVRYRYDRIVATRIASSKTVEEGSDYEAYLFLTDHSFDPYHIKATLNGKPLGIDEYLYHIYFPTTTADVFDQNGECRKKWKAEITIAQTFKDTTYTIEKQYIIKKKL